MQPNGPQNYWQPQNDQNGTPPPVPPQSPPQPTPPSQQQPAAPQPAAPTAPVEPQNEAPAVTVTPHNETFSAPKEAEPDDDKVTNEPAMGWEASEYISHEKDALWYLGFIIVVLALLGVAVWVQAWTFVALIIIMAIATIVYINRPPRTMRYSLSNRGLHIGEQFHSYNEYRAFGVVDDGPFLAIMLVSVKRFMPVTLIYFAEEDGDKIVNILSQHLPMEDLDLDLADVIIRKLRL